MLETSALYKQILAGEHRFEHYLTVNGVSYAMSEIYGVKTSAHLYRDDAVNVGGCVSSELKCMIAPKAAEIPEAARIELFVRLLSSLYQWQKWSIAGTYHWKKYAVDVNHTDTNLGNTGTKNYSHVGTPETMVINSTPQIVVIDGEPKYDFSAGRQTVVQTDYTPVGSYCAANSDSIKTASGGVGNYQTYYAKVLSIKDNSLFGWIASSDANAEIHGIRTTRSRGTYIEDVSSTNQSSYPQNGEQGGYWYVHDGYTQERGSYIENVSSGNQSAYPQNGIQDGYWYVSEGKPVSEWLPMGAWYIGARDPKKSGKLELHCYDALRAKGEQLYTVSGTWTRTSVRAAAQRCAALMGITLENANAWSNSVYLDAPPINYTVREVLSCCAAASCGNVSMCFSRSGGAIVEKLRLCPIVPVSSGYDLGTNRSGFVPGKPYAPYTHVIVNIDTSDGDTVSREAVSESDTGRTMEVTLFCVTDAEQAQAVADNLLEALDGYAYQPFTAAKAWLDPALELGDGFAVSELPVALLGSNAAFGPLYTAEIEAPCEDEIESEVPSEDSAKRAIERKIAAGKVSFDAKIDGIKAMVSGLTAPWEAGHAYSVGDIVEHDGKFYRCTVANSDSTFDPSKWTEIDSGVVESILQLAIGKMTLSVSGDGSGSSIALTSGSVRIVSAAAFFETNEAHFSGSLSANKISAGSIDADVVSVKDAFAVQMLVNNVWTTVGYVGAATGIDASGNTTRGAVLKSVDGDSYVIATNAGVRMQQGDTGFWIADNAISYRINGGDVTPLGYAVFS